jgi:hypothetical protein
MPLAMSMPAVHGNGMRFKRVGHQLSGVRQFREPNERGNVSSLSMTCTYPPSCQDTWKYAKPGGMLAASGFLLEPAGAGVVPAVSTIVLFSVHSSDSTIACER